MLSCFRGLVLSSLPWGDNDKILTVLTAEAGKIPVLLKGGASLRNKAGAACLPLSYTEFVTADRGGRPWVREASEIEGFPSVRSELWKSGAAMYMCDVAGEVCTENNEEGEMLQLMLNTLYALDRGLKDKRLIKAAFELRTAAVCGFSPDLVACEDCGKEEAEVMYLDVMDGVMHCPECRRKRNSSAPVEGHAVLLMTLDKPTLNCMRYICYSPAKKYLSFEIPDESREALCGYCEKYLLNHIDRGFNSLDFLKSLDGLPE